MLEVFCVKRSRNYVTWFMWHSSKLYWRFFNIISWSYD